MRYGGRFAAVPGVAAGSYDSGSGQHEQRLGELGRGRFPGQDFVRPFRMFGRSNGSGFVHAYAAFAAVAAATAPYAKMIVASILGAVDTDGARRIPADGAGECSRFHYRFLVPLLEAAGASLLIVPRQRWASSSAILKFSSSLVARSRR
jgi:hypothetical protein